ncbi:uncharacterized protein DS421_19g651530 [Arachis hypogaea]|uniref:Uncharacterized protein n=1 Tax=Arachis hypogaea TaxID=3818 RepID=A0A6B9VAQ5_ARAHY|nr:uncharacterized protein DS421_19g651530 [Arachis hypogaea]
MNPRNFSASMEKAHLSGLSLMPCCRRDANTPPRSLRRSSGRVVFARMSST